MDGDRREWLYRHYVANSLKLAGERKYYQNTLKEWLEPIKKDNRTVEEITEDVCEKAGITLVR